MSYDSTTSVTVVLRDGRTDGRLIWSDARQTMAAPLNSTNWGFRRSSKPSITSFKMRFCSRRGQRSIVGLAYRPFYVALLYAWYLRPTYTARLSTPSLSLGSRSGIRDPEPHALDVLINPRALLFLCHSVALLRCSSSHDGSTSIYCAFCRRPGRAATCSHWVSVDDRQGASEVGRRGRHTPTRAGKRVSLYAVEEIERAVYTAGLLALSLDFETCRRDRSFAGSSMDKRSRRLRWWVSDSVETRIARMVAVDRRCSLLGARLERGSVVGTRQPGPRWIQRNSEGWRAADGLPPRDVVTSESMERQLH